MQYEWVIGRFEGKQGEIVESHAALGIGYVIQRIEGRGKERTVYAAFKRILSTPTPLHLDVATPQQVEKIEAMSKRGQK